MIPFAFIEKRPEMQSGASGRLDSVFVVNSASAAYRLRFALAYRLFKICNDIADRYEFSLIILFDLDVELRFTAEYQVCKL